MSVCSTESWFCFGSRSGWRFCWVMTGRSVSGWQWITSACAPALWTQTYLEDSPGEQADSWRLGVCFGGRCMLGVSCWCPVIIDTQRGKRLIGFDWIWFENCILDWWNVKVMDEKQQRGSVRAHHPPPACFPSLRAPVFSCSVCLLDIIQLHILHSPSWIRCFLFLPGCLVPNLLIHRILLCDVQ